MERGEIVRKGPWTENEDVQLNLYVNLFGDRRWDFIAKVSGLKRSGKSCRLRWVNYLHPGLKRGKMSPQEERLVLELHSKWGNRWSRIARKLPGRTDNEIKNYWRSHMRKKAQEKKMMNLSSSSSSSLSNSSSHSSLSTIPPDYSNSNPILVTETGDRSFYDTGGLEMLVPRGKNNNIFNHQEEEEETQKCNFMMDDEIWDNMGFSELKPGIFEGYDEAVGCPALAASPIWDYCPDSLWMIGDGGGSSSKMHPPVTDQIYDSFYGHESSFLDG